VSPRAFLDGNGISRSYRTVQPVASRYTECFLRANNIKMDLKKCVVRWSGMVEPGLGEGTVVSSFDLLLPHKGGGNFHDQLTSY